MTNPDTKPTLANNFHDLPQTELIQHDTYCASCGYNLNHQPIRQDPQTKFFLTLCPECHTFKDMLAPTSQTHKWSLRLSKVTLGLWVIILIAATISPIFFIAEINNNTTRNAMYHANFTAKDQRYNAYMDYFNSQITTSNQKLAKLTPIPKPTSQQQKQINSLNATIQTNTANLDTLSQYGHDIFQQILAPTKYDKLANYKTKIPPHKLWSQSIKPRLIQNNIFPYALFAFLITYILCLIIPHWKKRTHLLVTIIYYAIGLTFVYYSIKNDNHYITITPASNNSRYIHTIDPNMVFNINLLLAATYLITATITILITRPLTRFLIKQLIAPKLLPLFTHYWTVDNKPLPTTKK